MDANGSNGPLAAPLLPLSPTLAAAKTTPSPVPPSDGRAVLTNGSDPAPAAQNGYGVDATGLKDAPPDAEAAQVPAPVPAAPPPSPTAGPMQLAPEAAREASSVMAAFSRRRSACIKPL